MRVLNSILMLTSAYASNPLEVDATKHQRHSYNKLVSLNHMMNQLTAHGKNLNPDDKNELKESKSFMKAYEINNNFFRRTMEKWYLKRDDEGNLVCAKHEKEKKNKVRRRRSDNDGPNMGSEDMQYHYQNLCEIVEDTEEACQSDNSERSVKLNFQKDYDINTKRMFGALKKWNELFLGDCKKNAEIRYKRIVRIMARRLFDGVKSNLIPIEKVTKGKWKRVFPKNIKIYEDKEAKDNNRPMNKDTLIGMVVARHNKRLANQKKN